MNNKLKNNYVSDKLYAHHNYFTKFVKLINNNKFPKILMLTGNKGQGKFTLVHHLMAYHFDKINYDLNLFQIKKSNKLVHGIKEINLSNIIYFDCKGSNTKIDDIRNLRSNLQKSSMINGNRYVIFDDVECLNANCVNALLKTLEEPSEINFFILINNKNKKILETLKSRALEVSIFLNINQKREITEQLIVNLNIEQQLELKNMTLTPGNYVKYNNILLQENIDIKNNIILNIGRLLKLYKTKKNFEYLNFAIYLTNQYYLEKFRNNSSKIDQNEKRQMVIKKIYESDRLNLNYNNLMLELETIIQ